MKPALAVVTGDPPVYPFRLGETLTGKTYFSLHHHRLLGSGWMSKTTHAERGAALSLWAHCIATQDPAGTLPCDDGELARLAEYGRDLDAWRRVRAGALWGWREVSVLGDSGAPACVRLAHPVMTEVAQAMFDASDRAGRAASDAARRQQVGRTRAAIAAVRGVVKAQVSLEQADAVERWLYARSLTRSHVNIAQALEAVADG